MRDSMVSPVEERLAFGVVVPSPISRHPAEIVLKVTADILLLGESEMLEINRPCLVMRHPQPEPAPIRRLARYYGPDTFSTCHHSHLLMNEYSITKTRKEGKHEMAAYTLCFGARFSRRSIAAVRHRSLGSLRLLRLVLLQGARCSSVTPTAITKDAALTAASLDSFDSFRYFAALKNTKSELFFSGSWTLSPVFISSEPVYLPLAEPSAASTT
jgi:hypothetical protein